MTNRITYQQILDCLTQDTTAKDLMKIFDCSYSTIKRLQRKYGFNLKPCSNIKRQEGNVYDKLTVVQLSHINKNGSAVWKCICQCGNIVFRIASTLRTKRQVSHMCDQCYAKYMSDLKTIDKSGQKHGKLTVLGFAGYNNQRNSLFLCKCQCGNYTTVAGGDLSKQNGTKSCGCIVSKGQYYIRKILQSHNINFKAQYSFSDCINQQTGRRYKYDFGILDDSGNVIGLIEYNGQQHYSSISFYGSWNDEQRYKFQVQKDKHKEEYCQDKNINLLIIPYTCNSEKAIENIINQKFNLW